MRFESKRKDQMKKNEKKHVLGFEKTFFFIALFRLGL
jgi:hypothetical protein